MILPHRANPRGYDFRERQERNSGFAMRFTGNFFSEGAHVRGGSSNHTLLVPLVACAVGASASGAVILSLAGSTMTQPGVSSISPRAIVQNADTSEPTKTAQDRPMVETPPRPAVTSMVSGRDELVTQTEAEHQAEVHSQRSRKHSQQRSREPHWQLRFAHAFSPWPHFSSGRNELTSGAR
jgi:hypothetical protein